MTDTTRPSWMPSRESLLSMAHNETLYANCGHDYAGEELEEVIRCAAIRVQIAVLEDLPVRVAEDGAGRTYMDRFIQLKIEALRKELSA